jgi:polyisoprenoid-binding protein YceI
VTVAEPGTAVGHYLLDKNASRFTVRAVASGILSAMGHNPAIAIRDFSGDANLDLTAAGQSSLRIQIHAESLEVLGEISNKDRREMESKMKQKVLESSHYPEIVFESRQTSAEQLGEGRYKLAINGSLSLRGMTRTLPVTAQVTLNGDMLRAYGDFSILQSEYGIAPVSVAGGALKLKDELKFTFDIVARKQEPGS